MMRSNKAVGLGPNERYRCMRSIVSASTLAIIVLIPPAVMAIDGASGIGPIGGLGAIPRPGEERQPLPGFEPEDVPPIIELPPVTPPPPDEQRLLYQPKILLKAIEVRDSTVLTPEEIEAVTKNYIGKEITTIDLQRLRYELTVLYINKGYITSGVIIPDQDVKDNTVYLKAIEGTLSDINISGNERLKNKYLEDRVRLAAEPVLNVVELQDRLQILNQGPLLDKVKAELSPDTELGKAILELNVQEAVPYRLDFTIDNYRPPSIGALEGTIHAGHINLTGRGDAADLFYSHTEGLDELAGNYALPITARDTSLSFRFQLSESDVVEVPFNELDVESKYEGFGVDLRHPFDLTPTRSIHGSVRLERRWSKTFLLGEPFSFSPGVQDGESVVSVIRVSADWTQRTTREVFALRSMFSFGIDAFGSTINDDEPDSQFFSWIGQFQWARRFGRAGYQAIFRTDVQWTPDELLPMEKFPIGGPYSVRGYRTNPLVRDNGLVSSLEFRAPVLRDVEGIGAVELALFGDYGHSWNTEGGTPDPKDLGSVGLAVRWEPRPKLHAELSWAYALEDIDFADYNLQDDGINFRVSYSAF